jgi:hypothetical protein
MIEKDHPIVDEKLVKLAEIYGKENLAKLDAASLYNLYKRHF